MKRSLPADQAATGKIPWSGRAKSVQPRIRLTRSFDQRSHTYQGYLLRIDGTMGDDRCEYLVGIGAASQAKHRFEVGDTVSGVGVPVPDSRMETADLYKASRLALTGRSLGSTDTPPPWHGPPPTLDVYRARGHRRLAAVTYETKCASCLWGCRMAGEMIVDQWKPELKKYRTETFCYGPLSCTSYSPGPTRKVPGRRGMTWEEEDWVDENDVAHRGPDE